MQTEPIATPAAPAKRRKIWRWALLALVLVGLVVVEWAGGRRNSSTLEIELTNHSNSASGPLSLVVGDRVESINDLQPGEATTLLVPNAGAHDVVLQFDTRSRTIPGITIARVDAASWAAENRVVMLDLEDQGFTRTTYSKPPKHSPAGRLLQSISDWFNRM